MVLCGNFPGKVSEIGSKTSAAPVKRIAWKTKALPDNGSLIAPPKQVEAPPKVQFL